MFMPKKALEKINEAHIEEAQSPESKDTSGEGLEIVQTEELEQVAEGIGEIKEAIDHDEPVSAEQVLELKEAIGKLTIDVGGEQIPIGELKDMDDLNYYLRASKKVIGHIFDFKGKKCCGK